MTYFVDGGIIDWGREPYGSSADIPQSTGSYERLLRHHYVNQSHSFIEWESFGVNASPPSVSTYERLKKHHYVNESSQFIQWESWGTGGETVVTPPVVPSITGGGLFRPIEQGAGAQIDMPVFDTALVGHLPRIVALDDTEKENILAILLMSA